MQVHRCSSFCRDAMGGNPAGVVPARNMLDEQDMISLAAEIGYSETAFAIPEQDGFRVRYLSPEAEVVFCGRATIALGAALAETYGHGTYRLALNTGENTGEISVGGSENGNYFEVALRSPRARSALIEDHVLNEALKVFGYSENQIDERFPAARIRGGNDHFVVGRRYGHALNHFGRHQARVG